MTTTSEIKKAVDVVSELLNIFLEFGPLIMAGSCVADIIHELISLWLQCIVIHSRLYYPQSHGVRSNHDIDNILCAWMGDNNSKQ